VNRRTKNPARVTDARLEKRQTRKKPPTCPSTAIFHRHRHAPATELFKGKLAMKRNGSLITAPDSTATTFRGVFAAGDVTDETYRRPHRPPAMGCMAALAAEHFSPNRKALAETVAAEWPKLYIRTSLDSRLVRVAMADDTCRARACMTRFEFRCRRRRGAHRAVVNLFPPVPAALSAASARAYCQCRRRVAGKARQWPPGINAPRPASRWPPMIMHPQKAAAIEDFRYARRREKPVRIRRSCGSVPARTDSPVLPRCASPY